MPFNPVYNDHIQLLHDSGSHWLLSFCSSSRVQICDSLKSTLNRSSMKSVYSLYKHVVGEFEKVKPTFLPVHKQTDGFNCGHFAIAYAAEILHGNSPMEANFDVKNMRNHLLVCLERKKNSNTISKNKQTINIFFVTLIAFYSFVQIVFFFKRFFVDSSKDMYISKK